MKLSLEIVRSGFKRCGLKTTPQRSAIYKALAETTSHPTADDLYREVSKNVSHDFSEHGVLYPERFARCRPGAGSEFLA